MPKRRDEWLLGRLHAKRLVRAWAREVHGREIPEDAIRIDSAPHGAPVVGFAGPGTEELRSPGLSLSHRAGRVLGALGDEPRVDLGVDLELVEPRTEGFVREWFTDAEVRQVEAASPAGRDLLITVIWSTKEAVLKVLGLGLSVDTRGVEIRLDPQSEPWSPFCATCGPFPRIGTQGPFPAGTPVTGWWRREGDFVLVIAGGTPPLRRMD